MIVNLPIRVPSGMYCWEYTSDSGVICEHFHNYGGHGTCDLDLGSLTKMSNGNYIKPGNCIALKEGK